MTKMDTVPIYAKNLSKSSSLEPKGWWCETWYAASSTPKFVKVYLWFDLNLFYGKVKFGAICFCIGKS